MAQSLARLVIHLVFSTKNRTPWLDEPIRPALFGYLATVGRDLGCEVFRVGGVADHVHLAIDLSRTLTVADFVKKLKQTSSVWLKVNGVNHSRFEWQSGYGAFSVGQSQLQMLVNYIDRQAEHHRATTFQEEYLKLLTSYDLKCDERYIWD